MKQTPAQLKAAAKYKKNNTTTVLLRFNNKTDSDILNVLQNCNNKNGYIKKLIRDDHPAAWLDEKFVAFHLTCSACGCNIRREKSEVFEGNYKYNFCPNCGARMNAIIRTIIKEV